MKIAAVCLTYARPIQLGRTIECFLRQTHPNCELLVYDDGFQYPSQPSGDRWRVVSVKERAPNLGTKRNLAVKCLGPGIDAIQTWDDDDIHLPTALAAMAAALEKGPWAQPRQALEWDGKQFRRFETFARGKPNKCAYHGNWGYRFKEFWAVGGYPPIMDDDTVAQRMTKAYGPSQDTISDDYPTPAYAYSRVPNESHPNDSHLSWLYKETGMDGAWKKLDAGTLAPVAEIPIGWDIDYSTLPIPSVVEPRAW